MTASTRFIAAWNSAAVAVAVVNAAAPAPKIAPNPNAMLRAAAEMFPNVAVADCCTIPKSRLNDVVPRNSIWVNSDPRNVPFPGMGYLSGLPPPG